MPRKAPRTQPPVLQVNAESDTPAIQSQLAALDRYDAQQQREQADEVEQLREAWAPQLSRAREILAELTSLQAQYGPTVEAIASRDFSRLPQVGSVLDSVAAIERACLELQHEFTHTSADLKRIVNSIEQLNERSVPSLHANTTTYRELLGFYQHTPQGVRDLFRRLERLVASLTEGIELEPSAETTTPVRRLTQRTAPTIEVEMA